MHTRNNCATFKNAAIIEVNKEPKTTNEVEVEAPKPEGPFTFTIEKWQKLSWEAINLYKKSELDHLNETATYKVLVKNTSAETLKFGPSLRSELHEHPARRRG